MPPDPRLKAGSGGCSSWYRASQLIQALAIAALVALGGCQPADQADRDGEPDGPADLVMLDLSDIHELALDPELAFGIAWRV